MALGADIADNLRLPVVVAPMFLVSSPELVVAACSNGVIAGFPAPNCRSQEELGEWIDRIDADLRDVRAACPETKVAPWGLNVVVHRTNPRLSADLEVAVDRKAPLIFASVGSPHEVVGPVHTYGGKVFADVATLRHARKAADSGVDGLVLLSRGAGGHEGSANPFAFVREVRRFFDGTIVLAGGVSDGASIRAAEILGADLVYMGTAFIAATESLAKDEYRTMLVESDMDDIVTTKALTGLNANMLRPSFTVQGLDPDSLEAHGPIDMQDHTDLEKRKKKRWKDLWAAGHGVGGVNDVQPLAEIVARLEKEYAEACRG